jgi:hypothetical protein
VTAKPAPDGVQREISHELEQVGCALDEHGVESSLEEVTADSVTTVEPCGVA